MGTRHTGHPLPPVHILVSLSLCLPQSLLLDAIVGHPEDCAFVSCSLSPQPLSLSPCPVSNRDPVPSSFPPQTLSPSGHMWTALLLLVLEVIPCYLLSLRALPACSWPFKILFVACEPGASLPLMSFYTPLPHMLAFPSVSSDLVQCVLPCSLVPLQASSCLSPFPVLSFPFLCWGWGEGGG